MSPVPGWGKNRICFFIESWHPLGIIRGIMAPVTGYENNIVCNISDSFIMKDYLYF